MMTRSQGAASAPEVPVPGPHPVLPEARQAPNVPIPVIYENEREQMSLRTYAAIMLRVPESGIAWLDKMIERSRELDRIPGGGAAAL